jgi:tetratricopeptide (TPR) repeat protein
VYTQVILRRLRVFKHVLRGMSYNNLGQHREALLAYRRALLLEPGNRAAQEGLWRVHMSMDFSQVVHDPQIMQLIDLDLCLKRATELLLRSKPDAERLNEAHKLLTLVLDQRPAMQPAVYYWRAVAHTHARDFDKAADELRAVLDETAYAPDDPYRESVLLASWQLALAQHAELRKRVGLPLLEEGNRPAAIAAVERQLAETPNDADAWQLKRLLYEGLTEAELLRKDEGGKGKDGRMEGWKSKSNTPDAFQSSNLPTFQPSSFDFDYCLQLGQALITDAARWQRGAEYLRIAARGLPAKGPSLYWQIAQAAQQAGDQATAEYSYEMVKLLAREIGPRNLGPDEKKAYFTTVKQLGEGAFSRRDVDKAIENLALYVESDQSGVDTLRLLTELYEKKGDALAALHVNERALMYDAKNKLFLDRKERYYYSVNPDDLRGRFEQVKKTFDVGYCVRKAKSLLDHRQADSESVAWALHLAELARVVEPDGIAPLVLAARARLRRGDQAEAVALLEEARANKPERFASADDEDAWYTACRLLGDLFLQTLGKPDQALLCFNDYRKYSKSGADTLYKMGQCYEQLGDRVKAAKCYQNVTVYTDHPLAWDASRALQRLETRS